MSDRAFNYFHPGALLFFIASVAILSMLIRNPLTLAIALIFTAASYISFRGVQACKMLAGLIMWICVLSILNGFFNPLGDTVLFTYLGGRHYTFESLAFGAVIGAVFALVVLWLGVFNQTVTLDDHSYLFGQALPAITMTLTLALRLEPFYARRAKDVLSARASIGKGVSLKSIRSSFKNALSILSSLVTWAMEKAIVSADSMRSRGYGIGARTSYLKIDMHRRDLILIVVTILGDACVISAIMVGALDTQFFPVVALSQPDILFVVGTMAIGVLSAIPFVVNVVGEAVWARSLSRI